MNQDLEKGTRFSMNNELCEMVYLCHIYMHFLDVSLRKMVKGRNWMFTGNRFTVEIIKTLKDNDNKITVSRGKSV